jgi:hypothetical protein
MAASTSQPWLVGYSPGTTTYAYLHVGMLCVYGQCNRFPWSVLTTQAASMADFVGVDYGHIEKSARVAYAFTIIACILTCLTVIRLLQVMRNLRHAVTAPLSKQFNSAVNLAFSAAFCCLVAWAAFVTVFKNKSVRGNALPSVHWTCPCFVFSRIRCAFRRGVANAPAPVT